MAESKNHFKCANQSEMNLYIKIGSVYPFVCATVSMRSAIAATFSRPVTTVNTLATPTSRPPATPARIPLGIEIEQGLTSH